MTRCTRFLSLVALLAGSAVPASANLITNSGFETGDFTGWLQSGNMTSTFVDGDPHSGTQAAWFGPNTTGFVSQMVTTVPGNEYSFSFWLKSDGGLPNFFSVAWNGTSSLSIANLSTLPYTQFTFTGLASGTSTEIKFGFRNTPGFLQLDDVSVVDITVPEPSSMVLLLLGASMAAFGLRRRSA